MSKRILFKIDKDYHIFRDIGYPEAFYCLTQNSLQDLIRIKQEFDNKEENVPGDYLIDAFPIEATGEIEQFSNVYKITSEEPIKFPINRIDWIWVQVVP